MNPYSGTPASAAEGSKWSAATLTFETQRGKKSSAGTAQTMWGWRDRVVHAHEVALGPEEQDHDQEEVEGAQGDEAVSAAPRYIPRVVDIDSRRRHVQSAEEQVNKVMRGDGAHVPLEPA